jgi:hypothetical protein
LGLIFAWLLIFPSVIDKGSMVVLDDIKTH